MNDTERQLTARDWAEIDLHHAVDIVVAAWPHARADVDAIGYPAHTGGGGGVDMDDGDWTATEAAALRVFDHASAWLAELHDTAVDWLGYWPPDGRLAQRWHPAVADHLDSWPAGDRARRRLFRLADTAKRRWPAPQSAGTRTGGTTIGARHNDVELCGLCCQPVAGGAADPIRRIDGEAYHARTCWYPVSMGRGGQGAHPYARVLRERLEARSRPQ